MEHKEIIPKTIAISAEVDAESSKIRATIRKAQDALRTLRNDPFFTMPDSLKDLSAEYCRKVYAPKRQAIDAMVINESDRNEVLRREKLRSKAERQQSEATRLCNLVRAFLDAEDLKPRFDPIVQNIVPSTDIHAVAVARVTRCVPEQAQQHYDLIQAVCAAINRLREWEQKNNVKKIPLQSLCRKSATQIAEQWATGDIYISADEEPMQKVVRESVEKTYL